MTAEEFNEAFALCHFLPGPNIVNLSVVFGSRFRGIAGGIAAFAGLIGPPMLLVIVARGALCALWRYRSAAAHAGRRGLRGGRAADRDRRCKMMMPLFQQRDVAGLRHAAGAVFVAIGLLRWPLLAVLLVAIPVSIALTCVMRRKDAGMNQRPIRSDAGRATFALMSLFAVGGANAAIPEMHRIAVDVQHWMTRQAVRRHVRDLAAVAGAERADRDADRLSRRGRCRRAGRDPCDVRADRRPCLLCEPDLLSASSRCALAGHHPGGAGPAFDRADGRERADFGADGRPELGGRA